MGLPAFCKKKIVLILRGYGLLGYMTNNLACPRSSIIGEEGAMHPSPTIAKCLCIDQLILTWLNSYLYDAPLSQVIVYESSYAT